MQISFEVTVHLITAKKERQREKIAHALHNVTDKNKDVNAIVKLSDQVSPFQLNIVTS